jgi:hypothetical protein
MSNAPRKRQFMRLSMRRITKEDRHEMKHELKDKRHQGTDKKEKETGTGRYSIFVTLS